MNKPRQQPSLEEMLRAFPQDLSNDWQLFAFTSGNFQFQTSCPVGSKSFYGKDLRQVITDAYNEMTHARANETNKTDKINETNNV